MKDTRPHKPWVMISRRFVLPLLLGVAACSPQVNVALLSRSTTAAHDSVLTGTWVRTSNVAGSRLIMTLSAADTVVTGTGIYSIEAGRSGALAVAGSAIGGAVKLAIAFDYGQSARFNGVLAARDTLGGTIRYETSDGAQPVSRVSFYRQ